MGTLNYENGESVRSHSKLGIVSLILSTVAFFMSLWSLSYPYTISINNNVLKTISESFVRLQQHTVLFNILGVTQVLLMIGAFVFSLIDIHKKESKKLLPIVSIMLIGILVFLAIKSLMYNNLL